MLDKFLFNYNKNFRLLVLNELFNFKEDAGITAKLVESTTIDWHYPPTLVVLDEINFYHPPAPTTYTEITSRLSEEREYILDYRRRYK